MKNTYSIADISKSNGQTIRSIQRRAEKEGWVFEWESPLNGGRKKVFPVKGLPTDIKEAVIKAESDRLLESLATAPVVAEGGLVAATGEVIALHAPKVNVPVLGMASAIAPYNKDGISDIHALKGWQKDTATARLTFMKFLQNHPKSQRQGIIDLLVMQEKGTLPAHLAGIVSVANNRSGEKAKKKVASEKTKRGLSERTLKRWAGDYAKYGYMGLVPESPNKEAGIPAWAPEFMAYWKRFSQPTINDVLAAMRLAGCEYIPSCDQVRRFKNKFSSLDIHKGRMSPGELRSVKGFVRRDTSSLYPGDVGIIDGHSWKDYVLHYRHKKPVKPETCWMLDVATRAIMGWSVGDAESAMTVGDCVRRAVTSDERHVFACIPAILYSDNGAGNKSFQISDSDIGLLSRIGSTHKTGIPGNPQGRGIIERFMQAPEKFAKFLPNYVGKHGSKDEARRLYLVRQKDVKETGTTDKAPTWQEFVGFLEIFVHWYNYMRPHSALPKIVDPQTGRKRHMTPAEKWQGFVDQGWQPVLPDAQELESLKRPRKEVTVARKEVTLFSNTYYANQLEHYHGQRMIAEYDLCDPMKIWIFDQDERLVAIPEWNRNRKKYFAEPVIEQAREVRANRRRKLKLAQIDMIDAELDGNAGTITVQTVSNAELKELRAQLEAEMAAPALPMVEKAVQDEEIPEDMRDRWEFWKRLDEAVATGATIPEKLARFHANYQHSADYRVSLMMEEETQKLMAGGF